MTDEMWNLSLTQFVSKTPRHSLYTNDKFFKLLSEYTSEKRGTIAIL